MGFKVSKGSFLHLELALGGPFDGKDVSVIADSARTTLLGSSQESFTEAICAGISQEKVHVLRGPWG